MIIDTHAHLYLEEFQADIVDVVNRAKETGVEQVYLPNIDSKTIDDLFRLCDRFPDFFKPMLGLHPVSVKADYRTELELIEKRLDERQLVAIGEIGSDAYWDTGFMEEQEEAFDIQCQWALERDLPIVIHSRDTMDRQIEWVEKQDQTLRGVFHCFTGTSEQGKKIMDLNFFLGIGGILTYKNSILDEIMPTLGLEKVVLETDAPYLSPVPFRGKRNESSYLPQVIRKLSDIFEVEDSDIERITSENARRVFS